MSHPPHERKRLRIRRGERANNQILARKGPILRPKDKQGNHQGRRKGMTKLLRSVTYETNMTPKEGVPLFCPAVCHAARSAACHSKFFKKRLNIF